MRRWILTLERWLLIAALAAFPIPALGTDCNQNRVEDSLDLQFDFGFEPLPELSLAFQPTAVVICDLDRDGRPDLATLSRDTGVASVLLNGGGGSFRPPRNLPVSDNAEGPSRGALAAADLDGDGACELAIVAPFKVDLLRNNGGGEMDPGGSYPLGSDPTAIVFADLDGDGDPDLATANALSSEGFPDNVSVFLNQGSGRLGQARNYGVGRVPRSILAHDLDRDGDLELVTADVGTGAISILFNEGEGSFPLRIAKPVGGEPGEVKAADFNGDGWPDLVEAGDGLEILFGLGQGAFAETRLVIAGSGPASLATGHFDGDGDADLAFASHRIANVHLLRNDGAGRFPGLQAYPAAFPRTAIAAGDLDGDGDADLAAVGGSLSLYRNEGSLGLLFSEPFMEGACPTALAAGDFNGDGRLDLAVANWISWNSGSLSVLSNRGGGSLALESAIPVGDFPHPMSSADLDGDSDSDLVLLDSRGNLWLALNGGSGFDGAVRKPIGGNLTSLALSDLDGNGTLETLVGVGGNGGALKGEIRVLSLEGNGSLAEKMVIPLERRPSLMVAADLDGDLAPEIAVAGGSSVRMSIYWNDRRGGFAQPQVILDAFDSRWLGAVDLDGDGDRDLVLSPNGILVNGGNRDFNQRRGLPGFLTASTAACDLDGDGDLDLASSFGNLSIFINQGSPPFSLLSFITRLRGSVHLQLACGDLDGDGLPDLAVSALRNSASGEVALLRNGTSPPRSVDQNLNQVPDECEEAGLRRGNVVEDETVDLTDAINLLDFLFLGGSLPACPDAADADDDGRLGIGDALRLLGSLFLGEGPLPPPVTCGPDLTDDDLPPCPKQVGC